MAALLAALGWGATVTAAEFNSAGDGSGTNNGDLLRDSGAGCENCFLSPPHEWSEPPFDAEWSLGLRGAYVRDSNGEHFEALALPRVTLNRETIRGGYDLSAGAQLSTSSLGISKLDAVDVGVEAVHALDEVTELRGNLELSYSQDRPGAPGQPGGILAAPQVFSGSAAVAGDRRFGQFEVGVRAEAARTIYGPTTLADASLRDNSAQNNWTFGGGLRLGYAVTPVLTAFVDGSAGYQLYDALSPIYLMKLDAADYELRTGLAADWGEVLEAEVSVGLGLRRFAEPALGEVATTLYDASLTFRPDETVALEAGLSTSFGAPGPNSGGTARLEYAATTAATYQVNPWLRLRASAGWRHAALIGTTTTESGYNLGAGLDYLLNEHTTLTADYAFNYTETTPNPGEDEQRVTLGVTLTR